MKTNHLLVAVIAPFAVGIALAAETAPKSIENLKAAFTGETHASQRYARFAEKADAEGEKEAARLFRAAAKAETIHAAKHRKTIEALGGTAPEVAADDTAVKTTAENLKAAIEGENHERRTMYPGFIKVAKEEGATQAVRSFDWAMQAETEHAKLYAAAIERLGEGADGGFAVCPKCGFTVAVDKLASECPVCETDGAEFLKF